MKFKDLLKVYLVWSIVLTSSVVFGSQEELDGAQAPVDTNVSSVAISSKTRRPMRSLGDAQPKMEKKQEYSDPARNNVDFDIEETINLKDPQESSVLVLNPEELATPTPVEKPEFGKSFSLSSMSPNTNKKNQKQGSTKTSGSENPPEITIINKKNLSLLEGYEEAVLGSIALLVIQKKAHDDRWEVCITKTKKEGGLSASYESLDFNSFVQKDDEDSDSPIGATTTRTTRRSKSPQKNASHTFLQEAKSPSSVVSGTQTPHTNVIFTRSFRSGNNDLRILEILYQENTTIILKKSGVSISMHTIHHLLMDRKCSLSKIDECCFNMQQARIARDSKKKDEAEALQCFVLKDEDPARPSLLYVCLELQEHAPKGEVNAIVLDMSGKQIITFRPVKKSAIFTPSYTKVFSSGSWFDIMRLQEERQMDFTEQQKAFDAITRQEGFARKQIRSNKSKSRSSATSRQSATPTTPTPPPTTTTTTRNTPQLSPTEKFFAKEQNDRGRLEDIENLARTKKMENLIKKDTSSPAAKGPN